MSAAQICAAPVSIPLTESRMSLCRRADQYSDCFTSIVATIEVFFTTDRFNNHNLSHRLRQPQQAHPSPLRILAWR